MSYIGNEPIVSATRTVTEVTATAGQTVFNANGGYTVGYLDVFLNGAQLQNTDFTATNGSSVTLTEAAQVNDVVRLVAWGTFSTSSLVSPNYTGTLTGGTDVVNIGSGQVYKDASGNVGIGTISPLDKLDVTGDSIAINGSSQYRQLNLYESGTRRAYLTYDSTNNLLGLIAEESGSVLQLGTAATERMRLDNVGNLLLGRTTTFVGSKFSIESTNGTQVGVVHNSSSGQAYLSNGVAAASTAWAHFNGVSSNNGAQNIFIYGNGNIVNANGSYGAISDIKLKENIVDASPKLEKLCQVRVVNYNLKGDYEHHKQLGVIAQEIEQIFPGIIDETSDKDIDGNELGTTTKSVKYSVFVPMLIKAIQEQQAIIQSQADTITAMEARLTALENK